ncbi:hypothetical protein PFISCL1PPCAC_14521, partial [Pristionchus fissidentatus]
GFYWNLARSFYGLSCSWALFGISSNSLILLTTIKNKSLRSTCNLLIALCSISDVFHQCGTLVQFPILFNYDARMSSDICCRIMFLPVMGVSAGCMCILCVGIDRLFSIHASIKYRTTDKRIYYTVC